MEYMGILLFLRIVVGSCIGIFIADRMGPPGLARQATDGRRDTGRLVD